MLDRPPEPAETPIGRRQPRTATKIAVALAVLNWCVLAWILIVSPRTLGQAEVLFICLTAVVTLGAAYLLVTDLMDCPRVRQSRTIFRLGMQIGRLRGGR